MDQEWNVYDDCGKECKYDGAYEEEVCVAHAVEPLNDVSLEEKTYHAANYCHYLNVD